MHCRRDSCVGWSSLCTTCILWPYVCAASSSAAALAITVAHMYPSPCQAATHHFPSSSFLLAFTVLNPSCVLARQRGKNSWRGSVCLPPITMVRRNGAQPRPMEHPLHCAARAVQRRGSFPDPRPQQDRHHGARDGRRGQPVMRGGIAVTCLWATIAFIAVYCAYFSLAVARPRPAPLPDVAQLIARRTST